MFKFYTAVGQLHLIRGVEGNKQPIIKRDNKVFEMNKNELIIWTSLMWHISEYDELFEVFKEKLSQECGEVDVNIIRVDFERTLDRLINRNLVVVSEDKVGILSVYNLISDLTIKLSRANLFISLIAFFKFVLIDKMPLGKARKIFFDEKLSKDEKKVIKVIKKSNLQTCELISLMSIKGIGFEWSKVKDDILENDKYFAIDDIMQTICGLYLRKYIQFE